MQFLKQEIEISKEYQTRGLGVTRGEIVLHGLFLLMAGTVLLLSLLMSTDGESQVFFPFTEIRVPAMCSTQVLFGIQCPGCGLTRAFISISHGQFAKAWALNHASFMVYAFVAVQIPWHGLQLWRLTRGHRPLESSLVYLVPMGLVLVLFANWVIRLAT